MVVKADVRGSLEAIQSALADLGNQEVKVNVVSGGVGGIAETDVTLAMTCNAMILGFNVLAFFVDGLLRLLGVVPPFLGIDIDILDKITQRVEGDILSHLSNLKNLKNVIK